VAAAGPARLPGPGGWRGYGDPVLHPVGPLPPSVYWRRRMLVSATVVVALLLGWMALSGGGDSPPETTAAVGSPPPESGTPTSLAATPPAGDRAGAGGGGAEPADQAAAPSPTPVRSAPPQPCSDSALQLRVLPERPAYRVGEEPVLDLVVRNVSTVACVRDLGAAHQEVLLYDGRNRRLWSSNDCYPGGTKDPQVLGPGDSASFSVTWSGLSSRPKCAGERVRVGAGSYLLLGRLGTLVSKRSPIRLT
jgi:hypothetical protein